MRGCNPVRRSGSVVVDDRSSAVGYTASWQRTASSAAINDTLRRSSSIGAVASYAFTGRGISLVVPTGPGRAKVAIYIDGVYRKTVNLRASSTHHRRVVYTASFAASGRHRITLKIVSAGKVQVDAFLVPSRAASGAAARSAASSVGGCARALR